MHNVHYAATATPAAIAFFGALVAWLVKNPKAVKDGVTVAEDIEQIPAVKAEAEKIEAAAKAEWEKLNAATGNALDTLASELAKALPDAIQSAVVAAKANVAPPAPEAPVEPAPADPAVTA